MKSLFSDGQVEDLISFVQLRSGKSGLLRYAGQLYSKHVVLTNQGFMPAPTGFQAAHGQIAEERRPRSAQGTARGSAESPPDRPQLLALGRPTPGHRGEPDPRPGVFLERCVGCHGLAGDGKGPGASSTPPPADFTDKDDACCGGDTGPGDFYYRILRGWPGTAWRISVTVSRSTTSGGSSSSSRRSRMTRSRQEPCAGAEGLHHLEPVEGARRVAQLAGRS